eukprot:CAMPEP_0170803212 /NCGR_PEP_ID=MMETSP0733-20121128/29863_1 /TAXON_ID=186038 /ORGANISM="Fragilariopsis kerguelensis, Strain L26-C5" /LENGTH=226 /DNA_ID=CAMNT_0011156805 /DNA_START=15 /DNA_END=692 /DNA_ORIENTATION=-
MKKKKKEKKKEEQAAQQQRAAAAAKEKEKEQDQDEGKRCGIKDLLCKTTHEELLKPYEFVGNPSIPPIAPPKPAGGFKKDGTPETETPSDENRSPNSSYEQAGSSEDDNDDLESGLVATAVKGPTEVITEADHSTHTFGRNLLSKFSRASSSHKKKQQKNSYHPNYNLEDGIGGSMMYATTMVTASAELDAIIHSATMVTAGLSEDDTDIYAKNLDNSDEYDEGYD